MEKVLVKNVTYMRSHCHELTCCNTIYLLSPWSRVLLEKLTGSQLVKKFPAFYWTALTSARHLSLILSQINPVHAPSLPEGYNFIRLVNRKACLGVTHRAYLVSELSCPLVFRYFEYFVAALPRPSTLSPFVTLLSRRAQSDRWSSFGKWVRFTESHIRGEVRK